MPFTNETATPVEALTGSLRDYRDPHGADLIGRVEQFFRWQDLRRQHHLWPYSRATDEAPKSVCAAREDTGERIGGINFGSQDYLSLASHPAIKEAAKAAVDEYGVHSAGSAAFIGNTPYSLALERSIADFLGMEHAVLYPTGWAAGFGVIKALVRPDDHVVMDGLCHSCLQEGAFAATRNVHLHGHLNIASARRHLTRIRARDTDNAILLVSESLFSMDSDTPDIAALQDLCREFRATLLIDCAHDLGNLGEDGRGHMGLQHMIGLVDIVMGSFSKTFASNGGFVACNSPALREYLKYYSAPGTFSNALSPIQAAIVLKAFDIVRSAEGRALRAALMSNITQLRTRLHEAGFEVTGEPSAIVPVMMREEGLARLVASRLPAHGVVANLVEYPAVAKGAARFRFQVMANHDKSNIDEVVVRLRAAYEEACQAYRPYHKLVTPPSAISAAVGD
ncbi:MAG TPA: aminotransferase class I/II-fold pyridoxal phosphate-dependent enzyme [Stellaceae bacterium]|jgi:glycine C-acetyltransferase|nr:aminotransferase class I/II-fold pyridoxal phosphate-dependent enzyme [Stellaceae bacterium]